MSLKEILENVELFDGLTADEIDAVRSLCRKRRLHVNEIITEQGDPGDELFIISEGFVEVTLEGTPASPAKVVINLGTGQTIGEMSLVDQGPRSATLKAISDPTILQVIRHDEFDVLCQENNRIGYIVMRNMAADLSFRIRRQNLIIT